ncbi:MAG: tetratricopeptide repeat protein [Isosphaeraceae bacterium]
MSDEERDTDGSDELLDNLERAKNDAINRCHYRTASRLAAEIKRKARAERRLRPYVWALHTLTNQSSALLEPEQGRESAVELIAVLESEDRARQIQPDLDMGEYESLVSWVSSCAYDNLGRATAASRGYNSEGLHEAIAEGIQVCRRTGKHQCIICFREYASDVFLASDDLQMALHHARHVVATGRSNAEFDRRWSGAIEEVDIMLVAGLIDAAEAAARQAWDLAGTYHSPLRARLRTLTSFETIRLLQGRDGLPPEIVGTAELDESRPSADEWPELQLRRDMVSALGSCLRGDHATATQVLTSWDRRLQEREHLEQWFEVRLRLIAAYRLAGDERRGEALTRQLEPRARKARDWLTLRRLARLADPDAPISPIASTGPIVTGSAPPTAGSASHATEKAQDPDSPQERVPTPLEPLLDEIEARKTQGSDDPETRNSILDSLLALRPDVATHPADVARMLGLAREFCGDPARGPSVWDWAESLAAPFPREASVLSLLGSLGETLRKAENSQVADRVDAKAIESLFRQSIDLDPNNFHNFGRAAVHYLNSGQTNEAERCLARCLRLDRGNALASLWLAEIYSKSERSNDALAILDMALRAGSDSPDVAWQAAVLAHSLGNYEALLTYLDHYESVQPGRPVVNYYRASGLIELGRHAEALPALDEEERRIENRALHLLILRACASSGLGRQEDFRTQLGEILAIRLAEVNYLTHHGLLKLFGRLWNAIGILGDDPLVDRLTDRLLVTGLAPNELFGPHRKANPKAEGVKFFVCNLLQPLDDRWRESPGCLYNEGDWTSYRIAWGALASDEAEAGRTALAWQARGNPLDAVVEDVVLQGEGYTDHPGIVWQGLRSS